MKSLREVALFCLVLGIAPLGCGGDDDDAGGKPGEVADAGAKPAIERLCEKAEECGSLPSDVSVDKCADQTNVCLDKLTSSQKSSWEKVADTCLAEDKCADFRDCYLSMNPTKC